MARASQKIRLLLVLTLVAMLLALVALPWRTLRAAGGAARPAFQYFPATGHNLGLAFKQFYEAHGGLPIFGLPLTEVISQDGMQVQYFERARLELHPELPAARQVALARLGSALTEGRAEPAFAPRAGPEAADRTFFPATGHTLGGAFGSFWQARGQLPVFGYPISEEFAETSVADGRPYLVQYFERARFEYHPEHAGTPDEVQLGHLGRAYARARGLLPELLAPARPIVLLGAATTRFPASSATATNIRLAAARLGGLVVGPGEALSFNRAIGEVTARAGFVKGQAIVGGQVTEDIGGGICQVSTALYQATFAAGLAIEERHPHSRLLAFFGDRPGLEAAVYAPDLDLRWRNDTPYDILIVADAGAGSATIALWGAGDGRTTAISGPRIHRQPEPAPPQDGAQPVALMHPGMDVVHGRVVRDAAGRVIRRDTVVTRYAAWQESTRYE